MKKLFTICAIMLLAGCVFAQNTPVAMSGTATITNAGTATNTITVVGTYKSVSIQAVVTKLTGTVTGVTAELSGSIDGVNYIPLKDTLTCTSATTNTLLWVLEGSNYLYYKISYAGGTTVTAQVKGYLFATGQGGAKHSSNVMTSDIGATSDTVTNSGSGYVQLQVKGNYSSVAIQVVSDKISGTAGGTVTLQGSNDGTNFVTVKTGYLQDVATYTPYAVSGGATLTVLNQATTSKVFIVKGSPYAYYRVSHTGTGTMVSRLRAYLLPNN